MQQIFAPLLLAIALSTATADPSLVFYSPAIPLRPSEIHNSPTSPVGSTASSPPHNLLAGATVNEALPVVTGHSSAFGVTLDAITLGVEGRHLPRQVTSPPLR